MELHGLNKQDLPEKRLHPEGEFVFVLEKDGVRVAFKTSERIRAKILHDE